MSGWLWLAAYVGCGLVAGVIAAVAIQADGAWKPEDATGVTAGVAAFWPIAAFTVVVGGCGWVVGRGCMVTGRWLSGELARRRKADQPVWLSAVLLMGVVPAVGATLLMRLVTPRVGR